MSDHGYYEELAALYALGALDGADLVAYEIHRRECFQCVRAERDYGRVTAGIVASGPAPESLKARVDAALPRRQGTSLGTMVTALAVAAVLLLCLGMFLQTESMRQNLIAERNENETLRNDLNKSDFRAARLQVQQDRVAAENVTLKTERDALLAKIDQLGREAMASKSRLDMLNKVAELARTGTPVMLKSDKVVGMVYYDPKGGGVVFFSKMLASMKENEHLVLWMIKEGADPMNVAHCGHDEPFGMSPTADAGMSASVKTFAISVETDPETKAPKGPVIVAAPAKTE